MDNIVNERELVKFFGGTKSVKSMVEKVIRKRYNVGVAYDLMSMKDHPRGTININSYDEADAVIKDLMSQIPNAQLEVKNNETSGYFGIHITGNIDGMNVEVQVHTEESSRIKEISDEIYHKWRNILDGKMTAKQIQEYNEDNEVIKKMYSDYFDSLGINPNVLKSDIEGVVPSNIVPNTPLNGTQELSLNSKVLPGNSVQSNNLVFSSERTNDLSGTSRPPIVTNVDITTPPDNLTIQENGGDVNNRYRQNGLNNITESGIINKNRGTDNDIRTDSNSSGQQPILVEKMNINKGRMESLERGRGKNTQNLAGRRGPGFTKYETDEGSRGTISQRTSGEILNVDGGVGNDIYPIYLNVGKSKNGDGYHLYDITKKVGKVAKQSNALERVNNDLRSEIDIPTNNNMPQSSNAVNNQYMHL